MESSETGKWKHSFLYLVSISLLLHLLHDLIPHRLLLGNDIVRVKKNPDLPLRFRYDGTFKILQVADMHYGNGMITRCRDVLESEFQYCSDLNTTRFLKRMLEVEKPDFIAFTGDNIFGPSSTDAAESLFKAFGPAMESGLPWAAVLGNHDQESTMNREELMSFISLMDYSVSQVNPSAEDLSSPVKDGMVTNIDGFGNYNLRVYGAPGSHLANNSILDLFFLDSGDREVIQGVRTYGWIKESQLSWLRSISHESQGQKQNSDQSADAFPTATSPALAFFHIPIPEIRQLYYNKIVGQFQDAVACSSVNSGVLQTLISIGDVQAVFMGHDHKNDFCGNLDGIWFCYGGGFGYHGYGKAGWPRRARVILAELGKGDKSWMGVKRIKTWKRLDDEKLSKIDEQVLWVHQPS
ncbi:probable inactive purple acid phosphatase 28 isoform X1 [Juglans microcarpa x Juglans regia]|uniref:probable inactive purple acid phosphatase 28 isoform X1 n=1 Tax=Juglans microcarpa x Juglans regia TaxID=2249226 RepID=UPI001B7EE5B5|nr:probable inactive purple acid phosphatase 28 isoform X1 [Juglans microcarpa x Juglans regia]